MTMIRRAIWPAALASGVAVGSGWLFGGPNAAWSAVVAVAVVFANFVAHGASLAWASTVSIGAVMAVALGGFIVRLGLIVGAMFALNTLSWFSPTAFGLTVMPATMLLLAFEARLVTRGLGTALQIPADPAAMRAGVAMAAREASS